MWSSPHDKSHSRTLSPSSSLPRQPSLLISPLSPSWKEKRSLPIVAVLSGIVSLIAMFFDGSRRSKYMPQSSATAFSTPLVGEHSV